MGRITSARRATVVSLAVVAAAAVAAPTVAASVARSTADGVTASARVTPAAAADTAAGERAVAGVVARDRADDEPPQPTDPDPQDVSVDTPAAGPRTTEPDDDVTPTSPDDGADPDVPGDVDGGDDGDDVDGGDDDDSGGDLERWRDNFFGDWDPDTLAELADTTAPVLTWRTVPAARTYAAAELTWSLTDENDAGETITFLQVDAGPAEAWGDARARLDGLPDGAHTVTVRAVDQSGNWAEPIVHSWTQLAAPVAAPRVTLTPVAVDDDAATFAWAVDDPQATVWFAVDDEAPRVASTGTLTLTGLAAGPHVLRVHAGVHHTDEVGSVYVDGRTASFTWLTGGGTWPEDWLPDDPFGTGWRG